jgi:hypothetical protein
MTSFRASAFLLALAVSSVALAGTGSAAPKNTNQHEESAGRSKTERCTVQHVKVKRHGRIVTEKKTVCQPVASDRRHK